MQIFRLIFKGYALLIREILFHLHVPCISILKSRKYFQTFPLKQFVPAGCRLKAMTANPDPPHWEMDVSSILHYPGP